MARETYEQQYILFPLPCFGLTGLDSGQTEPVSVRKGGGDE